MKPNKEMVDTAELPRIIANSCYPKPTWMLNESVYDTNWRLTKVGYDTSFFEENTSKLTNLSFKRLISTNEYLTDEKNQLLLTDIQNSLLYLYTIGKLTRPIRVKTLLLSITKLILHANEIRIQNEKPTINALSQLKFDDIKDYLMSFSVDSNLFDSMLTSILLRWNNKKYIDWDLLKSETKIKSREFSSLKDRLIKHLKSNFDNYVPDAFYRRQYDNANEFPFEIERDLNPKEKTISNEISLLEAFYTSRPSQKYKFQNSPMSTFSNGRNLFDKINESIKTPLMPVHILLHALSSSLRFARLYGHPLREYLAALNITERNRIKELKLANKTSVRYLNEIKNYSFENTKVPESLKKLNLISWGGKDKNNEYDDIREGMSVCTAVNIYTAAMWICLSSFSTGRTTSLTTLKRNCFKISPMDGLFDLVLRIPKGSERYELEDVYRPIPDLIYDYGLEFAQLANELEERRGYIPDENESFLFGKILSFRSIAAHRFTQNDSYKYPLGIDSIRSTIDLFQDWSESPLINGKRWYPSNHQFRRIFAVLYFNFSDHEGLDELSWFMGHANLEHTFHYVEVSPDDIWVEEAEIAIAKIGADLQKIIHGDQVMEEIIKTAREKAGIEIIIEPLVHQMINDHKSKTGQEVRFKKINQDDIFFYFSDI